MAAPLGDAAVAHDGAQRLLAGRFARGIACREPGIVHEDRLGAHKDGVDPAAQRVVVREGFRAGDPLAGSVAGCDAAVEGLCDVQRDERPLGGDGGEPALVQGQRGVRGQAGADPDARGTQRRSTSCRRIMGVVHGVDDVADSGVDDRLRAGARASAVVARLQGHHDRGTAEVLTGGFRPGDRVGFRVCRAGSAVAAGHQLRAVRGDDDGAHERVRSAGALCGGQQGRLHGCGFGGTESVAGHADGGVLQGAGVLGFKAHRPDTGPPPAAAPVKNHRREFICVCRSFPHEPRWLRGYTTAQFCGAKRTPQ